MKEIYHYYWYIIIFNIYEKKQTNFKILQMITNSGIQYYFHLETDITWFIRFLDYTMILRFIFGRLALLKMIIQTHCMIIGTIPTSPRC